MSLSTNTGDSSFPRFRNVDVPRLISTNITPSQQKLVKLFQEKLIPPAGVGQSTESPKSIHHLNSVYSAEMAQIQAFVNTILNSGIVTKQDLPKLQRFNQEFDDLSLKVQQAQAEHLVNETQAAQAKTHINASKKLLLEVGDLVKQLEKYSLHAAAFEDLQVAFTDQCYHPEEGDVLKAAPLLNPLMEKIQELNDGVLALHSQPTSFSSEKLLTLLSEDLQGLTWQIEDWTEEVIEAVKNEVKELQRQLADNSASSRPQALQQLLGLKAYMASVATQLSANRALIASLKLKWEAVAPQPTQQTVIKNLDRLLTCLKSLENNLVDKQNIVLEVTKSHDISTITPVEYGSAAWKELVQTRTAAPTSRLGALWNKTCSYLNPLGYLPEKWRLSSTQIQSVFLLALTGGEMLYKASRTYQELATLRQRADQLQENIFKAVPEETALTIDKERGLIGTLLNDKYGVLSDSARLKTLTKRYPHTLPTLQAAVAKYGSTPPTPEQISAELHSHYMQRMIQESPIANPFRHLSTNDWWELFKQEQSQPFDATPIEQVAAEPLMTSSAATVGGLVPAIIKSIGGLWNRLFSTPPIATPVEQQVQMREIQTKSFATLKGAVSKAAQLQRSIEANPSTDPLKEEISTLQRQLLEALADTPNQQCSLPQHAMWAQRTDDLCGHLESIEARLETALSEKAQDTPNKVAVPEEVHLGPLLSHPGLLSLSTQDASAQRLHTFLADTGGFTDDIQRIFSYFVKGVMPEKQYAHLIGHANPIIKKGKVAGEKLEGNLPSEALLFHLRVSEAMLRSMQAAPPASPEDEKLCCSAVSGDLPRETQVRHDPKLIEKLIHQLQIAKSIYQLTPYLTRINDFTITFTHEFRNKIIAQIEELQVDESFFFPQTWIDKENGHAMAWMVEKQANGDLTVRLYNAGKGLEYHTSEEIGLNTAYLHFTEVVNVKPAQFTSNSVIQGMLQTQEKMLTQDSGGAWEPSDFYQGIMLGIGGERSVRKYPITDLSLPQFVGICSMESIMAALNYPLGSLASAAQYRFWATLKGSVDFFEQVKGSLVDGQGAEERRRLLHDGIKVLAGITNKAAAHRAITDHELAYTKEILKQMRAHLKQVESQVQARLVSQEPPIGFEITSQQRPVLSTAPAYQSLDDVAVVPSAARAFVPIRTEVFSLQPATIVADLKDILSEVHQGNHATYNYLEVQKAVRATVLKIPLLERAFWQQIDDVAATKILDSLSELSKEFLWSFIHNDEQPRGQSWALPADDFLCVSKLLALADYLVRNYKNPQDLHIPSLQQKVAPGATLRPTPEWQEALSEIERYWQTANLLMGVPDTKLVVMDQTFPHNEIVISDYRQRLQKNEIAHDIFQFASFPAGTANPYKRRFAENDDFIKLMYRPYAEELLQKEIIPREWLFNRADKYLSDVEILAKRVIGNPPFVNSVDPNLARLAPMKQVEALITLFNTNSTLHEGAVKEILRIREIEADDYFFSKNNYLSDAEILATWAENHPVQVRSIDPKLSDLAPPQQAAALMQQLDKLPIWEDAYTISFVYNYFLTGSFAKPTDVPYDFSQGIQMKVEHFQKNIDIKDNPNDPEEIHYRLKCSGIYALLFGRAPHVDKSDPDMIWDKQLHEKPRPVHLKAGTYLRENTVKDWGPILSRLFMHHFDDFDYKADNLVQRARIKSNIAILINRDGISHAAQGSTSLHPKDLSRQQFRELIGLSTSKALQIMQTVGYFDAHSYLLLKPEMQVFFRLLMTEEDLLQTWIKTTPHAAKDIASFYKRILELSLMIGETNTATFITGMSHRLQEVFEKIQAKHSQLFTPEDTPDFIPVRETLNNIIHSNKTSQEQQSLAHLERAFSYRSQTALTPAEAVELVASIIFTHIYRLPEIHRDDKELIREVDALIRNHFSLQLIALMQGEHRNQILSGILQTIVADAPKGEWTSPAQEKSRDLISSEALQSFTFHKEKEVPVSQFPRFISPDGLYELDILDGAFKALGKSPMPFDLQLLKFPDVNRIFGANPPPILTPISDHLYEAQMQGERFRINLLKSNEDAHVYRFSNKQWYQLQPSTFPINAFHNKALITGKHAWYVPPKAGHPTGEILLSDQDTGKLLYRVSVGKGWTSTQKILKVVPLDNAGKDIDQQLVDANSPELDTFRRLEAPEYILAWSRNDVLDTVSLPRFGLTFKIEVVNGKRQAVSEQLSGYVLQEGAKQHIPQLGNIRHYLHLQRTEKDGTLTERIIFPRQRIKPYEVGPYRTDTELGREVKADELIPQHQFEYQVAKGELIPTATNAQDVLEANLYLTMIHLSERHPLEPNGNVYLQAKHYLEKADQQMLLLTEGLSLDSLEILHWIITLDTITQDANPDATALRLKAYYLLLRNNLDHTLSAPHREIGQRRKLFLEKSTTRLYEGYLTHLSYVDTSLRLAPNEELFLLKHHSGLKFTYRLNQLTKEMGTYEPSSIDTFVQAASTYAGPSHKFFEPGVFTAPTEESSKGIFLRGIDINNRFVQYYAIAKGEMTVGMAVHQFKEGMGLVLDPALTKKELLNEMRTVLTMYIAANKKSDWRSQTLLAVLSQPEAFPWTSHELDEVINILRVNTKLIREELPQLLREAHWNENKARAKKSDDLPLYVAKRQAIEANIDTAQTKMSESTDLLRERLYIPTKEITQEGLSLQLPSAKESDAPSFQSHRDTKLIKQEAISPPADSSFKECINLQTHLPDGMHLSLHQPIIPQKALETLVHMSHQEPAKAAPPLDVFNVTSRNPLVGALFADTQRQLSEYISKKKPIPAYELLDEAKVSALQSILTQDVAVMQTRVQKLETDLLELAQQGPRHLGELAQRDLQIEQGTFKLLTLDELVKAYYQRDYEGLHQRNTHLSKAEIKDLYTRIETYLLHATYLQHEQRILQEVDLLQQALDINLDGSALQECIRSFLSQASSKREYDPHEHPEYLVFEYYTDKLLWAQQIHTLSGLSKKNRLGALIELGMGMGKSLVLAPLLEWLFADGETIAVLLMPEALISSMGKDMQQTNGQVFGQKVRTLPIHREPITEKRLKRLHENLAEIKTERRVLLWTANDPQSLYNQWVELNEQAYELSEQRELRSSELEELAQKHALFVENFNLLIESGKFTADEIHEVFNILRAHSFTFGAPQAVHPDISASIHLIFETIVADQALSRNFRWEFLSQSTGESFTEESYHATIKNQLVEALIHRGISPNDLDFKAFFATLSAQDRHHLMSYLKQTPQENPTSFAAHEGYELLRQLPGNGGKKVRNQFATLKEAINIVLPKTAEKKPRVQFGLDANNQLIIPYNDGKPSENSIFGSVLERLIYTTQYTLSQGVPKEIIKKKLDQLKDQYESERALGHRPDLTEFKEMVSGSDKYNLLKLTDGDYEEITKLVSSNPLLQLKLNKEFRYPSIKVFAKEIESSAHVIPLLAKKKQGTIGMSGTLSNVPTLPKIFQQAQLSETQVKTLDLLLQRSSHKVATLPSLKGMTPQEKMQALHANDIGASCTIDALGQLSVEEMEEAARAKLEIASTQNPAIQGVVYYDNDVLKVVTKTDTKPILYSRELPSESLVAIWDVAHTTGSDIPVGQFTKAKMIVDKHITLSKLQQGAWRMRGLAKGQTVDFMVPEKDREVMKKMLQEHLGEVIDADADLTLPQLFRYALLKQALEESENTYQAVRERMKMALVERITNIAWNKSTSASDAFEIYKQTRALFITQEPDEPWDHWGQLSTDIPTAEALQKLLKEWKESPIIASIEANPSLYKGFDVKELFAVWENEINTVTGPLPETVKTHVNTYGKTAEKVIEKHVEKAVERKTEQHVQKQVREHLVFNYGYPRERIETRNPFLLSEAIPTPIDRLVSIPEADLNAASLNFETGLCVKANDILQTNKALANFKDLFDNDLLMSLNIAPVQDVSIRRIYQSYSYNVFDSLQKPCSIVEVIQDPSGQLKLKLVDVEDADRLLAFLTQEPAAANPDQLRVGLYQFEKDGYSLDAEGPQKIDLQTPAHRARFLELLVQAKIIAGVMEFKPEEVPYLRAWINKVGVTPAFDLINIILNPVAKSDTRASFPKSVFAKVLNELGLKETTLN